MFNTLYFFIFCSLIIFSLFFRYVTTLVSIFFFTELLWILIFSMSSIAGCMFDDIGLYGLLVIILFVTAFEAGILIIIYKFFPLLTQKPILN